MLRNSTECLAKFELATIQKPTDPVEIKDVKFVASYNWSNSDEPVIFVPGCPARWSPPQLPCQLKKGDGQARMDQNNLRSLPESFDPFFKALLTMSPKFDMNPIQLTTDRNSLRKLLKFAEGKLRESWRIDVDVVENTMFFTRWEENQLKLITGARDSGYGHEFEKIFLAYDSNLRETSEHNCIVRYNLGGIECLVRFEVDGYVDDGLEINDPPSAETILNETSIVDEVGQAVSGLQLQNPTNERGPSRTGEVKVIKRGRQVDDSTLLELKLRSGSLRMPEIIPQLWFSQTRHLFVGGHKEGYIEVEPGRYNMDDYFSDWERNQREHLCSLVGLTKEIKEAAKRAKGGKCMLVCMKEETPRVLKMYARDGKEFFLPEGVRTECWSAQNI